MGFVSGPAGTAGLTTGLNAQYSRAFDHSMAPAFADPSRGSAAPASIHLTKSAITLAGSFPPLGGILRSPSWRIALTIRLSAALPGTRAGPVSPPVSTAAWLSRRRPPDCFFSPWHEKHCSVRTGRILASKNSTASGVGLSAAKAGAASRTAATDQGRMKPPGGGGVNGRGRPADKRMIGRIGRPCQRAGVCRSPRRDSGARHVDAAGRCTQAPGGPARCAPLRVAANGKPALYACSADPSTPPGPPRPATPTASGGRAPAGRRPRRCPGTP